MLIDSKHGLHQIGLLQTTDALDEYMRKSIGLRGIVDQCVQMYL